MAVDRAKSALIRRSVLRGTLSNYAGSLVTLAVGFLLTPFVLAHIGPTGFGLWALVGSVVAYGSLLDLGISAALIKYVAEHHARGAPAEARATIATALRLYAVLGAVAALLGLALAPVFPDLFRVPPEQRATASRLVLLLGLGVGVSIPCTVPAAVLAALCRFDLLNIAGVIGALLAGAATVAVLLSGGGLIGLAAVNVGATLITQGLSLLLLRHHAPGLVPTWRGAERGRVGPMVSFSASVFAVQVAGRVQGKTDELVIAAYLPVSAVTPFALARRLGEIPQALTDQFMKLLLPLAAALDAGEDRSRVRAVWLTGTRLTLALCLPLSGTLALLGGPILALWVGAGYARYAPLVALLALAILVDTLTWPTGSVMQAMARHRPLALVALISAAANLGLSILLAPRLGLLGVALGTLIPTAIEAGCVTLPYAMRVLGVPAREAWRALVVPVLPPAVVLVLVLVLLGRAAPAGSAVGLLVTATAGVGAYVATYVALGRGLAEREMIIGAASRAVARWRPEA